MCAAFGSTRRRLVLYRAGVAIRWAGSRWREPSAGRTTIRRAWARRLRWSVGLGWRCKSIFACAAPRPDLGGRRHRAHRPREPSACGRPRRHETAVAVGAPLLRATALDRDRAVAVSEVLACPLRQDR